MSFELFVVSLKKKVEDKVIQGSELVSRKSPFQRSPLIRAEEEPRMSQITWHLSIKANQQAVPYEPMLLISANCGN